MRDACHAVVNSTQWRRYPVINDGQNASRREQWTRLPECLAGAAYSELWVWRHCVRLKPCVQLECEPRDCSVAAAGSVICTHWIVCRLSCGRGSDAVRGMFVDCGRATWCVSGPFVDQDGGLAGLEALVYWTHLCYRVSRNTDTRLCVSNEYLSCRFGRIIECTGFIMNKHISSTFYITVSRIEWGPGVWPPLDHTYRHSLICAKACLGVPWPPTFCSNLTLSMRNLVQTFDSERSNRSVLTFTLSDTLAWLICHRDNLQHPTSNFKWGILTKCTC